MLITEQSVTNLYNELFSLKREEPLNIVINNSEYQRILQVLHYTLVSLREQNGRQ